MDQARLLAVATAVPPHVLDQETVCDRALRLYGLTGMRAQALRDLFANTGIRQRYSARPFAWFEEKHNWPSRTDAYLQTADDLFVEAANKALAAAGISASEVGAVVTVSSTGVATPSIEARVFSRMGFDPGVERLPVFGLGCAGGVSGLARAARMAQAMPGKPVLMVAIELCTLSFRSDEASKKNLIATALFGDGAAAAVLVAGGEAGRAIEATGEHLWADTLPMAGWTVDPEGFGLVLTVDLPAFAVERFGPAADAFLAKAGIARESIGRFVCHPGGAKVLPALEASLGLEVGSFDIERAVIADYGNMSSPSVLFVLERVLASEQGRGRLVLNALGPGFTGAFAALGPDA